MSATRLCLDKKPPRVGARGPVYVVHLGSPSGPVIVEATTEPFLAGCRWLKANGYTGTAELWDAPRQFPRMTGGIAGAASLTVQESETVSPTFTRWRPFPVARYRPETANSEASATPVAEREARL